MPSITIGKEEKVQFCGTTYSVKKMALGQYAKFSEKLEELLPDRKSMETLIEGGAADRVQIILCLFKSAPVRFAELMQISSGIPLENILQATPDEVFDLAEIIYELNEIDKLGERIKKVLSLGGVQAGN